MDEIHHIIPWELCDDAMDQHPIVERLAIMYKATGHSGSRVYQGWHPSNPTQNGFIVPKKLDDGKYFIEGEVIDGVFHVNHPAYNVWIEDALFQIHFNVSDENLFNTISSFNLHLKSVIEEAYTKKRSINDHFKTITEFTLSEL